MVLFWLSLTPFDLEQTALTGSVTRECDCVPVENEEYLRLEDEKIAASLRPTDIPELQWKDLKGATYQLPGTTTFDYSRVRLSQLPLTEKPS